MNRHFWRINHWPNHTTLKYGFWCFENIIIEILVLVLNAATVIGCQVAILLTRVRSPFLNHDDKFYSTAKNRTWISCVQDECIDHCALIAGHFLKVEDFSHKIFTSYIAILGSIINMRYLNPNLRILVHWVRTSKPLYYL